MREQFTFYRSYFDAIGQIKNVKDRAAIYDAIAAYALYEREPNLSDVAAAIFSLVRPTLDASRKKSESGKLGGSKSPSDRKQTASKPQAEAEQTTTDRKDEAKPKLEIELGIELERELMLSNDSLSPKEKQEKKMPLSEADLTDEERDMLAHHPSMDLHDVEAMRQFRAADAGRKPREAG